MKKLLLLATVVILGWTVSEANVSFGVFYSSLGSYGEWISIGTGSYAWRPAQVGVGWRPYVDGRWIWTDDGWYWATDEPWGWATYHYGRWYDDDYYGWVWVPGYDWAPAWVEWRYGGDYIGWAPLGPYAIFSMSFGIHYSHYWSTPYRYWSFVDCRHMGSRDMHRYIYRTEDNTRLIGRTRGGGSVQYDGGRVITRGPGRDYVERRGNLRLERADIVGVADRRQERVIRMEGRERVETYRPKIDGNTRGGTIERPERVREGERPLNLDTRSLDLRSREESKLQGRDLERAAQYRNQGRNSSRRTDVGVAPYGATGNPGRRTYDRTPGSVGRTLEQPSSPDRRYGRSPDPRREPIDRPPRHSQLRDSQSSGGQNFGTWGRSASPDRGGHRSEARQSGGGRSGGKRGGR